MSLLQKTIEECLVTTRALGALEEPLAKAAAMVTGCLLESRKLLTCGNGGSASDATHVAT